MRVSGRTDHPESVCDRHPAVYLEGPGSPDWRQALWIPVPSAELASPWRAILAGSTHAASGHPSGRQHFGLLKHRPCRLLLLVGWVAVLSQDALDEPPKVGALARGLRPFEPEQPRAPVDCAGGGVRPPSPRDGAARWLANS